MRKVKLIKYNIIFKIIKLKAITCLLHIKIEFDNQVKLAFMWIIDIQNIYSGIEHHVSPTLGAHALTNLKSILCTNK